MREAACFIKLQSRKARDEETDSIQYHYLTKEIKSTRTIASKAQRPENQFPALHIGRKTKCMQPCPVLKVHKASMKQIPTVRYLGDIISEKGTARDNIEYRRSKGWGKIAEIVSIVGVR